MLSNDILLSAISSDFCNALDNDICNALERHLVECNNFRFDDISLGAISSALKRHLVELSSVMLSFL